MIVPPSPIAAVSDFSGQAFSSSAGAMASGGVDDSSAVRVAVRARPLIPKELMEKCKECVTFFPSENQMLIGKDRRFTFDYVFAPESTQEAVYIACVKPLVESCMSGYNATVLAYGQTGSGKTHTMGSGNNTAVLEEELGILPRVIRQLFESVDEKKTQAEFLVRCAFVEIYNEEIKDLLHPDTPCKSIAIREDANGDIILAGVRDVVVTNYEDMIRCLENGSMCRTTGSTLMNQYSSRSHAIFTIIIEQRQLSDNNESDVITAKFHLVDLAGSERAKRTGAVGVRFKESVTINCGLLALGNVISALGDEKKRCTHVPYRESKLTRMLQDSLGGNSRTCMIACISTADTNFEETLNTLKYANRARNIRNKPVINRDPQAAQLNQMRSEIQALQLELLTYRMKIAGNPQEGDGGKPNLDELLKDESNRNYLEELKSRSSWSTDVAHELQLVRERSLKAEQECLKLKEELQKALSLVNTLSEETLELRTERDHYQLKLDELHADLSSFVDSLPDWGKSGQVSDAVYAQLYEISRRVGTASEGEASTSRAGSPASGQTGKAVKPLGAEEREERRERVSSGREASTSKRDSEVEKPASEVRDRGPSVRRLSDLFEVIPATGLGDPGSPGAKIRDGAKNIINQHLRAIRELEAKLAAKEKELKDRDATLTEASEDLARDEMIFAEKMKEIKALKKLARELTREKEILLEQKARDADIISRLQQESAAKEDELARLQSTYKSMAMASQGFCMREPSGNEREESSGRREADESRFYGTGYASVMENEDEVKYEDEDGLEGAAMLLEDIPRADVPTHLVQEQIVELVEKIKVLQAEEEEKVRLLAEKATLEEANSKMEEAVRQQKKDFQRTKQTMDKQLHELSRNIQEKEELIQELGRNEAEAKFLSHQYEARMLELEAEMRRKEEEVDQLRAELEALDKNVVKGAEEKRRLREECEAKVKKVHSQLQALKKQQKEQEAQKMERVKAKSEMKVQQLEQEIQRMRLQQESLKRKIKEATDKFEDQQDGHLRELAGLKRDQEVGQKRIRELELKDQKLQMVLRRKTEENAAAHKKLKELGMMDAEGVPRLSNRERSLAYDHALRCTPRKRGGGFVEMMSPTHRLNIRPATAPLGVLCSTDMSKLQSNFEKEIEKMLKLKEAVAHKEKQEAKRNRILAEKDECLNERSKLELKRMRAAQLIATQLEAKAKLIRVLDNEIEQKQRLAEKQEADGQVAAADELMEEAISLREKRDHEHQARLALEEKRHMQKYLSTEEEAALSDIDERIEAVDAEAEYITAAISDAMKEIQDGSSAKDSVKSLCYSIGVGEAKFLLRRYIEQVVEVKEKERQDAGRVAELTLQLHERAKMIAESENNLRMKEMEFDRRVTELQKQHARKIQLLLKQINAFNSQSMSEREIDSAQEGTHSTSSRRAHMSEPEGKERLAETEEKLQDLEKDNFYYKQEAAKKIWVCGHCGELSAIELGRAALKKMHYSRIHDQFSSSLKAIIHGKEEMGGSAVRRDSSLLHDLETLGSSFSRGKSSYKRGDASRAKLQHWHQRQHQHQQQLQKLQHPRKEMMSEAHENAGAPIELTRGKEGPFGPTPIASRTSTSTLQLLGPSIHGDLWPAEATSDKRGLGGPIREVPSMDGGDACLAAIRRSYTLSDFGSNEEGFDSRGGASIRPDTAGSLAAVNLVSDIEVSPARATTSGRRLVSTTAQGLSVSGVPKPTQMVLRINAVSPLSSAVGVGSPSQASLVGSNEAQISPGCDGPWTGSNGSVRSPGCDTWIRSNDGGRSPHGNAWTGSNEGRSSPRGKTWTVSKESRRSPRHDNWMGSNDARRSPRRDTWAGSSETRRSLRGGPWTGLRELRRSPRRGSWGGSRDTQGSPGCAGAGAGSGAASREGRGSSPGRSGRRWSNETRELAGGGRQDGPQTDTPAVQTTKQGIQVSSAQDEGETPFVAMKSMDLRRVSLSPSMSQGLSTGITHSLLVTV